MVLLGYGLDMENGGEHDVTSAMVLTTFYQKNKSDLDSVHKTE